MKSKFLPKNKQACFWRNKISFREIVILFAIFGIILVDARRVFPSLGREMMYIANRVIRYPQFSYEDKMKEKVGKDYYDWTELVREYTSVNSKAMHPPQMWPWGQSGNPEFSQYFLYPAKLVRENRQQLLEKSDITHVLIAWGEGGVEDDRLFGWPKFPIFAKKIYYLPQRRKVEVEGLVDLQEWKHDALRAVNFTDGRSFDLTYTSSSFDYWIKPIKYALAPSTDLSVKVRSNWLNSTALVAKISFGNEKSAVFSSDANQKTGEWETLSLKDLYARAYQFANLQGWSTSRLSVDGIGIDTGHPAKMPYLEKWGLAEVEKGGEDRLVFLHQQTANTQNFLSLGNVYMLEEKLDKAFVFYQAAQLLEPADPWPHFWVAEIANKTGKLSLAQQEYQKAVDLAPNIPWFYYTQGQLYEKKGDVNQAQAKYQESLKIYPESFWSHLALGKIYESMNKPYSAYQHYNLASFGPRWAFSSDGKLAWEKRKKIEAEQNEIIKGALQAVEDKSDDWGAMATLATSYIVLGELDKAKEQYKLINESLPGKYEPDVMFPPIVIDQLYETAYAVKGKAIESVSLGNRPSVILDDYHGYLRYSSVFFPAQNGTIELSWKPPKGFEENSVPRNLIYQMKGIFVWIQEDKLNFALFDPERDKWETISSSSFNWEFDKWYKISVSYGDMGMYLFLNSQTIAKSSFTGGINEQADIFLSRGPLWSISDKPVSSGYFETLKIYDYQKLKWE